MSEQRFPAGSEPRVLIERLHGDLEVNVRDGDEIVIMSDTVLRDLRQEGDAVIFSADDDLELSVPSRCLVQVDRCRGDIELEGVDHVVLQQVSGDVELEAIGVQVEIGTIHGDLEVDGAPVVICRDTISGDVDLSLVGRVELERVGADLQVEQLSEALQCRHVGADVEIESVGEQVSLTFDQIGADLDLEGSASLLQCNAIGGDCTLEGGTVMQLALGNLGGDLEVEQAGVVRVTNVGSDCTIKAFHEALQIGSVGGDCRIDVAGSSLEIGNVGADCRIGSAARDALLGNVGGDCSVRAMFPAGSVVRANVGGDARLIMPEEPSLVLRAAVGGTVSGPESLAGGSGRQIALTYGEGAANCELHVGGNLELGEGDPQRWSSSAGIGEFGREMGAFGREMGNLGRELGRELSQLGRELAAEISAAFANEGSKRGKDWAETIAQKIEQKASRLQERLEDRTREEGESPRLRVKINDREWRLDPERLERIKEQARRAAADGVSGAMEAVERALSRIRVPDAATPPAPPAPPEPPQPPAATGQTIRIEVEDEAPLAPTAPPAPDADTTMPDDLEQQRETILRMIAEGRLSPEEGDLLLEALTG